MKTVTVSELTGAALDWAVAKAVGYELRGGAGFHEKAWFHGHKFVSHPKKWNPSTDWNQGGPLIASYKVSIKRNAHLSGSPVEWSAVIDDGWTNIPAETPLIALCRAIVSAKLGDTVEVPEELL